MATVSDSTTEPQLRAAYANNCGYREDDDATKAAAFITVCNKMLDRGIRVIEFDDQRFEFSPATLADSIKRAERFLVGKNAVTAGGSGVKFARFGSRFRG